MGPLAPAPYPIPAILPPDPPYDLTIGIVIIYAIILAALILFIWEPIPIDITAIAIIVTLITFGPWLNLIVTESLSGFSSTATITVLAMFILSEGIRRTGVISVIGKRIAVKYGTSYHRQLIAVLGLSGGTAGIINNTPVVAVMIPIAVDVATTTGLNPFAFAIAVTFAASTAFMTPVGYQTNLMVYGPGGYQFSDYLRVGAPLQLLLSVVTVIGITMLWGVT